MMVMMIDRPIRPYPVAVPATPFPLFLLQRLPVALPAAPLVDPSGGAEAGEGAARPGHRLPVAQARAVAALDPWGGFRVRRLHERHRPRGKR